MDHSARADRVTGALRRAREVAAARGVAGLVLTRPGPVAWATAGMNPPIDRTAATDVVWLAVGPQSAGIVTTEVEAPRIEAELRPADLGLSLVATPWWGGDRGDAMVTAAADLLGAPPSQLGSDGHPAFGADLDHDLTAARLALSPAEQAQLRLLGREAAGAVEQALRQWSPGETDWAIAARIAGAVEAVGADAPELLVGGDDRLRRWRHPVAVGAAVQDLVMAVLVARRDGLHVALTRYASTAAPDPAFAQALAATRAVHRTVLAACRPAATVGSVLTALDGAYAERGYPQGWTAHYQGGPIGYGQREFEIAPAQTASPWWGHRLAAGTAVAWNPSVPGGAKDEDTYLIGDDAVGPVTDTGQWPMTDDGTGPQRPEVLVVSS